MLQQDANGSAIFAGNGNMQGVWPRSSAVSKSTPATISAKDMLRFGFFHFEARCHVHIIFAARQQRIQLGAQSNQPGGCGEMRSLYRASQRCGARIVGQVEIRTRIRQRVDDAQFFFADFGISARYESLEGVAPLLSRTLTSSKARISATDLALR